MRGLRRFLSGLVLCVSAFFMVLLAIPTLALSAALSFLWAVSDEVLRVFSGDR